MKKRIISKMLAISTAIIMIFGGVSTVYAEGTDDGCYHGDGGTSYGGSEGESGGFDNPSDSGSGSSSSVPSYESSGSSGQDNSSSDNGGSYDAGQSYTESGSSGTNSSAGGVASTGLSRSGNTASVPGKETFRKVCKPADGVDTSGYAIGTAKGSVTYLPKLGMSGVMLNGVLVVNAEETVAE